MFQRYNFSLHLLLSHIQEAAEWAFNRKDQQGFLFALSRAGPSQRSKLDEMRVKLFGRT